MLEAYKDYWVRALDFSGKTSRSDYWYAFLVNFIVGVVLAESILNIFSYINWVPGTAIALRRLRSAGKNPLPLNFDWFRCFLGDLPLGAT